MRQTCPDVAGRLVARQIFAVRARVFREADDTGHFVLLHERAVEPQLVANDTAAEIGAQVIQMFQRLGVAQTLSFQLVVQIAALQRGSLDRGHVGTMELIGSGLDHGDHRNTRHRHFRVVARCSDLRLFERQARHVDAGARPVGDVDAVDLNLHVGGLAVVLCGRAHAHPAVADVDAVGRDAGRHREQLLQPAADRNRFDGVGCQVDAGRRRGHVDDRARAGDGDRLFQPSDAHRRVDSGDEPDRQTKIVQHIRFETGELEGDVIEAGGQLADAIVAVGFRHHRDLSHLQGGLVIVTVTPGIAAPCSSFTVP